MSEEGVANSGQLQVSGYVAAGLFQGRRRRVEPHVDPLNDSFISLDLESRAEFRLSGQNQAQGREGVHAKVRQEVDLLQHLFGQEMSVADDDDHCLVLGLLEVSSSDETGVWRPRSRGGEYTRAVAEPPSRSCGELAGNQKRRGRGNKLG